MASNIDNINNIPTDLSGSGVIRGVDPAIDEAIQRHVLDLQSRTPMVRPAGDINDFFPLVENVLLSRQNYERIPEDKRVLFLEEDPPEPVDSAAITFEIQARVPGSVSQGPAGTGGVREVRPHFRKEQEHPEHPGEKLVTMGKFYDNWIRFNVRAKTNKEARRLLLWFEKAMDGFDWYFKYNGFKVVEEGVGDRERVEVNGVTMTRYPIVYFVKSEDIFFVGSQELKEVIIRPTIKASAT